MKRSLTIYFLISTLCYCQNQNYYDLKWKLSPNKIIIYKTITEENDSLNYKMFELNFEKILDSMPDSLQQKMKTEGKSDYSKIKEFYNSLNKSGRKNEVFSVLTGNSNGSIDIKMIMKPDSSKIQSNSLDSMMQILIGKTDGIVLRGLLNEDGSIGSFYLRQRQKNLLAMYFELPAKPVKIGDSWSLEINLLEFDQNFICNKSEKRNKIELIDVKKIEKEEIAFLKYDIFEMVSGNILNPISRKSIPTFMLMSFSGVSEFSITKGRWKKFNSITKTESTGFSESNSLETNIMIPVESME